MTAIRPNEVEIVGRWEEINGKVEMDAQARRILDIIRSGDLKELARSDDGWSVLYRDVGDDRLWELRYPQSQLAGGGPPALVNLSQDEARERFGTDT